jgi:hypothetical protein
MPSTERVRQGGKLGIAATLVEGGKPSLRVINAIAAASSHLHRKFSNLSPSCICLQGSKALDFESARPPVVKSIRQRDLLNTWLRLYDRARQPPHVDQYQPERLSDEMPDLVYYTVDICPAAMSSNSASRPAWHKSPA